MPIFPIREDLLEIRIQAARGDGHRLDTETRRLLEQAFGWDLSCVRVHDDAEADRLARSLGALAFTTGVDVFFRSGMYDPASVRGLHLLAHEVTHVVQQATGSLMPKTGPGGISISNPTDPEEVFAEACAVQIMANLAQLRKASERSSTHKRVQWKQAMFTSYLAIQRAIGLEIEIPVPIDQLTAVQIAAIKDLVQRETTAGMDQKQGLRLNAVGMRDMQGSVAYGTIRAAAGGFRVDADHDDRVTTPNPATTGWPIRQGSRDSIIEIVMEPPTVDQAAFTTTMNNIDAFITQINTQTNNLTTHWVNAFPAIGAMVAPVNAGPLDYTATGWYPAVRLPNHNFQGSVQVNVGIDLREYHSLLKWYADSDYASPNRVTTALEQALYRQIKTDITLAVDVGRTITQNIYNGMTAAQRQQNGNLRGLRGWITHLALYLIRGKVLLADLGGSIKNLAPILLKSPNTIVTQYGMTAAELAYFGANRATIMNQIFQRIGRPADVGQPLAAVDVFVASPGRINADTLSNVAAAGVTLTGGPILNATGVGPLRTGNVAVQALPTVVAGPGIVGGGANTRGGMVVEFRTLPGYYDGPASWRALGTRFLQEATARNNRNGIEP